MAQIPGTGYTSQQQYNPSVRGPEDYSMQIRGAQQKEQQRRGLRGAVQQAGQQLSDVTGRIVQAIGDHRVFQDSLMWEKQLEKVKDSVGMMIAGAGEDVDGEGMEGFATSGVQAFEGEADGMQRWQMANELFEKEAEKIFKEGRTSSGIFSSAGRRQFDEMKHRYWHQVRDRQQELFGAHLEHLNEKTFDMAIEQENPQAVVRAAQLARDNGVIAPWEQEELRRNGLSAISFKQSSRDAMNVAKANGAVVNGMSNIDVALEASTPPSADLREYVTGSLQGRTPQEAAEHIRQQAENGEVDQQTAQAAMKMLTAPSRANGEVGPGLGVFRDPETNTWHLLSNEQFSQIHSQVREYAETEFKARKFATHRDWRTQIAIEKANGTIDNDEWRQRIRDQRGLLGYSNYDEKDLASNLLGLLEDPSGTAGSEELYRETQFFGLVSKLMQNRHLPREAANEMIYDILQQIPEGTGVAKYDGLREWLVNYSNTERNWQERSQAAADLFEFADEQLDSRIERALDDEDWSAYTDLVTRKASMQRDIMNYLTDEAEFDVNESGNLTYNERAAEQIRAALRHRASGSEFAKSLQQMFGDPSGNLENVSFDLVNGSGFGRGDRKQLAVTAAKIMSSDAAAGMDPVVRAEFQNEASQHLSNFFAEEHGASDVSLRKILRKNGEVYLAPRVREGQMREEGLENYLYQPEGSDTAQHIISYRDRNGDGEFEWMIANLGGSDDLSGDIMWEPVPDSIKARMPRGYTGFTPLPDYERSPAEPHIPQQPSADLNADIYPEMSEAEMRAAGMAEEDIQAALRARESEVERATRRRGGITE